MPLNNNQLTDPLSTNTEKNYSGRLLDEYERPFEARARIEDKLHEHKNVQRQYEIKYCTKDTNH